MTEPDDEMLVQYVVRVESELDFFGAAPLVVGPFDTRAEAESYADGLLPYSEDGVTGTEICELHSLVEHHCEDQDDAQRRHLIGEISHEV